MTAILGVALADAPGPLSTTGGIGGQEPEGRLPNTTVSGMNTMPGALKPGRARGPDSRVEDREAGNKPDPVGLVVPQITLFSATVKRYLLLSVLPKKRLGPALAAALAGATAEHAVGKRPVPERHP